MPPKWNPSTKIKRGVARPPKKVPKKAPKPTPKKVPKPTQPSSTEMVHSFERMGMSKVTDSIKKYYRELAPQPGAKARSKEIAIKRGANPNLRNIVDQPRWVQRGDERRRVQLPPHSQRLRGVGDRKIYRGGMWQLLDD